MKNLIYVTLILGSGAALAGTLNVSEPAFYSLDADGNGEFRIYFDQYMTSSQPFDVVLDTDQGPQVVGCPGFETPCYLVLDEIETWQVTNTQDFDGVNNGSGKLYTLSSDPLRTTQQASLQVPPAALPVGLSNQLDASQIDQLSRQAGDWVRLRGGHSGGLLQTQAGVSLGTMPMERVPLNLSLGIDQHLGRDRTRLDAVLGQSTRLGQWLATGSVNLGLGEQSGGVDSNWLSVGGELWHTQQQSGPFVSLGFHFQGTSQTVVEAYQLSDWKSRTLEMQGGWRHGVNLPSGLGSLAASVDLGVAATQTEHSGFYRSGDDLVPLSHTPEEVSPLLRLSVGQSKRGQSWLVGLDYVYQEPRLALHWNW